MNYTKISYTIAMALMMLIALPSCDKDNDNDYRPQNEAAIQKAAIALRVNVDKYNSNQMWSNIRTDEFTEFASKVTTFSNNASAAIGAKSDGNTVVSPLSVFMALAMAAESADGDTRKEILDVMGITYEELNANIRSVCYLCNQCLDRGLSSSGGKNQIKSVNSLWVKDGIKVKGEGVNALTSKYFTDLFYMKFNETDVNKIISSYISNETEGLLNPKLEINPETFLVLMNVVYLREIWNEYANDLSLTDKNYNFVNYDQSKTNTQLLQGYYNSGKAIDTEKFRKFYTTTYGDLSLTFIVPKDGYTLDDIYTAEQLNNPTPYTMVDTISDPEVNYRFHTRCFFPEFKASFDGYLENTIKAMGVKKFFTRFECDFSHLTDEGVYCDKIRHVAQLEVNRKGIEGAAVTIEEMRGQTANNGPAEKIWKDVYEDFIVDRNFAFIIQKNGLPIFTGVVKTIK